TRNRGDKLVVMQGGHASGAAASGSGAGAVADARAPSAPSPLGGESRGEGSATARAGGAQAATALREEARLSPTERLDSLPCQKADAKAHKAEQRLEAKAKGYEGEMCGECGNFTLVRNGTCLKCDTCGGTTGCS
ncbi:MAG TPA: vitamin B12-dependent ribonucleotide reductase, partial [Xanthobacteraceae bacterium]